jgi:hypothetical protein
VVGVAPGSTDGYDGQTPIDLSHSLGGVPWTGPYDPTQVTRLHLWERAWPSVTKTVRQPSNPETPR